jgi:hypothetical protein
MAEILPKPALRRHSSRSSDPSGSSGSLSDSADRRSPDRYLVWALAVVAALVAARSSAAPTGTDVIDMVWCAALGALVTVAASRARRWPTIWFAGVVSAGSLGSWWVLPALVGLGLAVSTAYTSYRNRVLGAAVGAIGVQAMLRMPDQGFHGLPSLIALVAVVPLLASAYERSSRRVRRRSRRTAYVLVGLAAAAAAMLGITALLAGSKLTEGVRESKSGLELIRDGDQEKATGPLAAAAEAFQQADHVLAGPWGWPARAVPVVAQHREALVVAAHAGHDLAATGASAAATAPYQDLKATKGQVDVALAKAMQKPVREAAEALQSAHDDLVAVRSPWLTAPMSARLLEFEEEVDGALPEAQLASGALALAPGMLGAEEDQTYLVLFTNPAETRFLGGFTGSYGLLTAHQGEVDFTVSGRITELLGDADPDTLDISGDRFAEYQQRYGRYDVADHLQNLTASPDMPTDAEVAHRLYEQATGTQIDGVIVVDPYGLAGLLELTGPVEVEGFGSPLTADNAAAYLVYQQYLDYGDDRSERKDRLEAAGRAVFDALTSRDLPGPRTLGKVLGPLVEEKRLMFYPFSSDALPLFDRIGTLGAFDPDLSADFLSLRTANANPNKIDSSLHRSIDYDVAYDPGSGSVDATATITLVNDSPSSGLPAYIIGNDRLDPISNPPGSNEMYLSWYSPLELDGATVDGVETGVEAQREAGARVYSQLVTVPSKSTVTVVLHLRGTVPRSSTYRLQVLQQPLVQADRLSVTVRSSSEPWKIKSAEGLTVADGEATTSGISLTDHVLSVTFGG